MSKKILHLQIPIKENKRNSDMLEISPQMLGKFLELIKSVLNKDSDEWIVIASPCIPTVFGDSVNFYNFESNKLSKDEFLNLIGEDNNDEHRRN